MSEFSRRAALSATWRMAGARMVGARLAGGLLAGGLLDKARAEAFAGPPRPPPPPADATDLAARIRRGDISAPEAVDQAITRARAAQPRLNFLAHPLFEEARQRARSGALRGPFAGAPILVKDLTDVRGAPTRSGSRWTFDHSPAQAQGAYVEALERAGLVIIGKSATPEYGLGPATTSLAFGPTLNPWMSGRRVQGSSGGAAAAVAAGVVPFAHASDGAGSIRIPAACAGLFGLKPSRGRMVGADGGDDVVDLSVDHCLSRSVRDSAALFAATERTDADAPFAPVGWVGGASPRRLSVGVVRRGVGGKDPDREADAAVSETVALLRGLGHRVRATDWPVTPRFQEDFATLWALGAAGLARTVAAARGRDADGRDLEPFTLALAGTAKQLPEGGAEAALARLEADRLACEAWLAGFDVVVSPVLDPAAEGLDTYTDYAALHNVAGTPAMSLPLHWTRAGRPVGVQVAARAGGERTLFELAYELEAAQPWSRRLPPVWVG